LLSLEGQKSNMFSGKAIYIFIFQCIYRVFLLKDCFPESLGENSFKMRQLN
jgi:hypothetical protein